MTGRDLDAFGRGLDNARAGRLVWEGMRRGSDKVERALCVAGFECQRIGRGIGSFPVLIYSGYRRFWLVGQDGQPGTYRPVFQVGTMPGGPATGSGYYDLRALFRLKGVPQA